MQFASFTILLAAGFLFVQNWNITKIMSLKEGHTVYFASVVAALPLFVISNNLYISVESAEFTQDVIEWISKLVSGVIESDSTAAKDAANPKFLPLAIISLFAAPLLAWLANIPISINQKLSRFFYEEIGDGEPLDSILSEATDNQLPILITLSNGKVYLGYSLVTELFGQSDSQWLHLAPWLSGYRNQYHRLEFTTTYAPVAWRSNNEQLVHDARFQIAIPLSAVSSVTPFDMEIYRNHFNPLASEQESNLEQDFLDHQPSSEWKVDALKHAKLYLAGVIMAATGLLALNQSFLVSFVGMFVGVTLLGIASLSSNNR